MPLRSAITVCRFAVLTSMNLVTASVAQEPSGPSAGAVELSKIVVQHPEFSSYFEGLVRSELDPRMGSDFGIVYLQRSDLIWSTLQADLATSFAAGCPRKSSWRRSQASRSRRCPNPFAGLPQDG